MEDQELVRLFLAGRNVSCPTCGFNLRDGTGEVCPECGMPLRLHIHPVVQFTLSYVLGTLGLVSGVVLAGLAIVDFWGWRDWRWVVALTGLIVAFVHLVIFEARWWKWMRAGSERRVLNLAACWAVAAACAAMMAWQVVRWLF